MTSMSYKISIQSIFRRKSIKNSYISIEFSLSIDDESRHVIKKNYLKYKKEKPYLKGMRNLDHGMFRVLFHEDEESLNNDIGHVYVIKC